MVIGNGLIAQTFQVYRDSSDVLIFASGVSNSSETDPRQFERERTLLAEKIAQYPTALFVYFSTCSIEDPDVRDRPYIQHKRICEERIQLEHASSLIVRLPQVVGRTPNPHTLTNFLYQKISSGDPFDLWVHATRSIIDIDDARLIANALIDQRAMINTIVSIVSRFYTMTEVLRTFESVIGKTANCRCINKGVAYSIKDPRVLPFIHKLHINFDDNYLGDTLKKYYNAL